VDEARTTSSKLAIAEPRKPTVSARLLEIAHRHGESDAVADPPTPCDVVRLGSFPTDGDRCPRFDEKRIHTRRCGSLSLQEVEVEAMGRRRALGLEALAAQLALAGAVGGCGAAPDGPPSWVPEDLTSTGRVDSQQATLATPDGSAQTVALGADNAWTWYGPIAGARCADGSPTGFAINPLRTGNGKLLILLEGGGLCADANSCKGPLPTVTHTSYGASDFVSEMTASSSRTESFNLAPFGSYTWSKPLGSRGLWDRTAQANPFRDYSYVFVPYCTADLFAGARQDTSSAFPSVRTPSGAYFNGFTNFAAFAQQVRGAFPSPPSIALVGGSAGGLGTLYNYPQLKALYPGVPMSVISDSGVPFWTGDDGFSPRQGFVMLGFEPPGVPSYEEDWFADAWGLDGTHPAGVPAVTRTGARRSIYPLQDILIADAVESSDQFGIVDGSNDYVIPWFMHLSVNGLAHPNVSDGQADLSAHVKLANVHTLWVSSSQAPDPNLLVWNQHHQFVFDDVSFWSKSGLLPWLTDHFTL
jgi:hypothetical protein